MHRRAYVYGFAVLVAHSVATAQSAASGEAPLAEDFDKSRTLNGHAFIPFVNIPWPFVSSRVTSRTGMGVVKLTALPVVNLGLIEQDAKLVAFSQSFDADAAVTRFIGLTGSLSVGHAAGINEAGAFNLGVNYAFGGSLGVIGRLAHGERWYLSLRADAALLRLEAVLPVALTQSATVDENGIVTFDLGALTRGGQIARGSAHLMLAAAPLRMLSLQSNVGYEVVRTSVSSDLTRLHYISLGLGGSVRFNDLGVPLALLLGGSLRINAGDSGREFFSTIESAGRVIGDIEPGVFYSDPKFVDIGLLTSFRLAADESRTQVRIVLNHFW